MRAEGEGRWWPVGPNLVSDQMAAPVPEIVDDSLYVHTNATGLWLSTP
jgi:hypothetical protein